MTKERLIYHNQTSLQHLLQNKLNTEYLSCDNWKIYLMFISINKLGNGSIALHGGNSNDCDEFMHLHTLTSRAMRTSVCSSCILLKR